MNQLKSAFLSRKTTISLMFLQALIYFVGAVVPQRLIMEPNKYRSWQEQWPEMVKALEFLGITAIFSSPLTYVLTALFFLHLVFVTWYRIPAIRAAMRLPERANLSASTMEKLPSRTVTLDPEDGLVRLRQAVNSCRYSIVEGDGCFRAIKNAFSPVGSLLFHVSFIVMLAGAVTIFHSRFSGGAYVTVGQEFHGTPQEYFHVRRYSSFRPSYPEMKFKLTGIYPEFEKNEAVSLKTEIVPLSGAKRGEKIAFNVNFPYTDGSKTMLVKDIGVSPYFEVRDLSGKELLGAFISLNILKGDVDHFVIPGTSYDVQVRYWPDFALDAEGYIFSRSFEMRRPLFKITVLKDGREIADGKLHSPAEKVAFEGLQLSYKEIRYFGTFNVTDEHGGAVLTAGFIIALIGLVVKFLFERREILVLYHNEESGLTVTIACRNEYYQSAAVRELARVTDSMAIHGGNL